MKILPAVILIFLSFVLKGETLYHGYDDCVELVSDSARAIITPSGAGRLLHFSLDGKNVIVNAPEHGNFRFSEKEEYQNLSGGTFVIGPEANVAEHFNISVREWQVKRQTPKSVLLETVPRAHDLFRAERFYNLDGNILTIRQTVKNVSGKEQKGAFWGRIWTLPNGYHAVIRNPYSRFRLGVLPRLGTVMGHRFPDLNWENILLTNRYLIVTGNPGIPKLDFDPNEGVIFYLMKNNLQLTIRFPVKPGQIGGEPSSATVCLYYTSQFSELEPLGPLEMFRPGESKSFTIALALTKREFPSKEKLKQFKFE